MRFIEVLKALWQIAWTWLRRPNLVGWLGPYLVSEKIGQGGMGVIYKAIHPRCPKPVAIKLLPAERTSERTLKRFEREARLTSVLRHPNTVSVFDSGMTREGAPYYVMELLDGVDLQTLVQTEGPQPAARVAHLLTQLAAALEEVHRMGFLHGDVKPANVVCCSSDSGLDRVKILDFGLARELSGGCDESWAGDASAIVGTPLYLSPEALLTPGRVDERSDLYALGAVGYFLLTGLPPFAGKTILEVFTKHVHATPVRPSEALGSAVPRELEDTIMSCLAKAPDARPAHAGALHAALLPLAARWGTTAAHSLRAAA